MPKMSYKFFISSVVNGLERERNAVDYVISKDHVSRRSECFVGNESSRKIIQRYLEDCHCYIGIFDTKWGTIPKEDNPKNLSITALEYYEAKEMGLPVFIIVSNKPKKDPELKKFLLEIGEMKDGENWNRYSKPEEISTAIALYLPELIKQIEEKPISVTKTNKKIFEHNQKFTVIDSLIDGTYEKPNYFDSTYKKIQNKNTWIIGSRGIGKSIFLKKITQKLQKQKKQVILFRAEEIIAKRDFQNITKDEFGITLDKFVKKISKTNDLYIIIDSVETIARTEAWNSFSVKIPNLQKNNKIHTILSIRDSDYTAFRYQFKSEWGEEIELHGFTLHQVKNILKKFKIKGKISTELYEVLRTPFYLMILGSLVKSNKTNFSEIHNNFQFLQEHYEVVVRNNENEINLAEKKTKLLSKICKKMLDLKQFKIPKTAFPVNSEYRSLRSDGVILEKNNSLEFFHHVYFDYLMSLQIIDSGLIVKFLNKVGTELFLRSTIFFTLDYLRYILPQNFIINVNELLKSNVSYYWKRVTLEFFANLTDANVEEIEVLQQNIEHDDSLQVSFLEYVIDKKNSFWYDIWTYTLFTRWSEDSNFKQGGLLTKYITLCVKGENNEK